MNKNYQDISVYDKNKKELGLLIPRASKIFSIIFNEFWLEINYLDTILNEYKTINIDYESLKYNKVVID